MAIESNRLVVRTESLQKKTRLSTAAPACGPVEPVAPGQYYYNPDTNLTEVKGPPEYEGQICFAETKSAQFYQMYVGVAITPGILSWKRCAPSSGNIDPRTGQPYDPLLAFYSPLAN